MDEKITPTLNPEAKSHLLLITDGAKKSQAKPNMKADDVLKASSALEEVKKLLPRLDEAEKELRAKMELGHEVSVEKVDENDERYVEMNVMKVVQEGDDWSADSDPDSPESPVRPDHGDGNTTDSDSDSTISTSSGSASSSDNAEDDQGKKTKKKRKVPLIEEIPPNKKHCN